MKSTSTPSSIAHVRERVRRFLRERTIETLVAELQRGELRLADLLEELYLCHAELQLQQDALQESQSFADRALARFAQLFRYLPAPTLLLSSDGVIKDYNQAASETLALDCRLFPQLATGQDTTALENALQAARTRGHALCAEATLRSARYDHVIADVSLLLLPAQERDTPEIVCTLVDQTDRVAQRRALISTAEVVDASATVAIRWQAKPGWPLVYASDNVKHWGFPPKMFVSGYVHLIDLAHPEDREALERIFTEAIAEDRPHFTLTCRFIWADDSVHWVELETGTRKVSGPSGPCYQGLIRDVTEREQAQAALRQQLRFQKLISDISSLFANSLRESLEAMLDETVAIIGQFFGADRCYLHHPSAESGASRASHVWWRDAAQVDAERQRRIEADDLAPWLTRLESGEHVCIPDIMRLPPEDDEIRMELTRQVIRSRMLYPLSSEGRFIGILGLDTFLKARAWTAEEIELLGLLSASIASMLIRQEIEDQRQASETRYQHLSATMSDVAYASIRVPGDAYRIDWITDSIEALTGYGQEELLKLGGWGSLVVAEDRHAFATLVQGLEPGATGACELRLRHRDGSTHWVRATTECLQDAKIPRATRLYGGLVDITERKTRETELQRLALIVEQSPSIMVMTDLSGTIEYVNARFCEVTGYEKDDVCGRNLHLLEVEDGTAETWTEIWEALRIGETWRGELENRKKSGEVFWEDALITPLRDEHGGISHFVKLAEDVSDRKALSERLAYLTHFDPLTGLPNRRLLRERIERAIVRARKAQSSLALLSIDLDKLKLINDSMGHEAGDQLLRDLAQRLQEVLGPEDIVGRFGSDNFVLLASDLTEMGDSVAVAERVRHAIEQPISLPKGTARITASIGISLFPDDATTCDALLSHADTALHKAKGEGRRLFRFYTPALNEQLLEQFQLEQALRHGLEHDELLLHYQPRVDIRTGRILSLEALVRWMHPTWGLVAPSRFIPLAESTGLILDIGPVVLKQACSQLKQWQSAGLPVVPIAVNLSAKELYQDALSSQIQSIMHDAAVDPHQIEIEITESATMRSIEEAIEILTSLRKLGLALSIDDFGTGHASLSYLNRLPMQAIKIDRSFLVKIGETLGHEPQSEAIIKAIIGLGLNLGMQIVAEGVETPSQRDFLIEHGCEVAQGYLFSHALPAHEIEPLLRAGAVPGSLH